MKIADHLSKEQKQRLEKLKNEKLSRKDIEELMGIHQDTFARHKGAVRRK